MVTQRRLTNNTLGTGPPFQDLSLVKSVLRIETGGGSELTHATMIE